MADNMYLQIGDFMWEVKEYNPLEYSESTWAPAELKAEIVVEAMAYGCRPKSRKTTNIKKVIFNPPATVVIWNDNTKTIVKCMEGDDYDAEKGLALCYMKRICESGYSKELKRAKDWEKERTEALENVIVEEHPAQKALYLAAEAVKRRLFGGVENGEA